MRRTPITTLTLALLTLGACSSSSPTEAPPAPSTTVAAAASTTGSTVAQDPYQAYLAIAPADAPELTPDDAQARAMLGCSTTWAPGTVDAALQQAYAPLIEQWRTQGLCG